MNDFTQMHVFFAVTTAAVILLTAIMGGVLVAVFRFFNTLNRIAGQVHEEAEAIREDLQELREGMAKTSKVFRFVPLFSFFAKTAKRAKKRTKKTRTS